MKIKSSKKSIMLVLCLSLVFVFATSAFAVTKYDVTKADYKSAYKNMKYPTIKEGSTGTYVKMLQYTLIDLGYNLDKDGIFGPKTKAAVKKLQGATQFYITTAEPIDKDGIVGKYTWGKLSIAIDKIYVCKLN